MKFNVPMIGLSGFSEIESKCLEEILNNLGLIYEKAKPDISYFCLLTPEYISSLDAIFEKLAGIYEEHYVDDNLLSVPVNIFAESLREKIKTDFHQKGFPLIRKSFWPDFAPACAIITHDIDTMNNPPTGQKVEFVKYAVARKVKGQAFNDNVDNILDIEKKYGVNASFYFFSDYGKHQEHFKKMVSQIPNNHEIGLHGSQHSFQSYKHLEKEKSELEKLSGKKIIGTRQHGLNFIVPHTWRYQEKAGFEYDMTHAYNDKFGFRAGICHPFRPFDSLTKEQFKILEIPTSFMDWTALHQGLNHARTMDMIKEICSVIEKHNGVFVSIFHNMYINEKSHPDITQSFIDMIKYLRKQKYWITTADECSKWWRMREYAKMNITSSSEGITILSDSTLPVEVFLPDGRVKKISAEAGKELFIEG